MRALFLLILLVVALCFVSFLAGPASPLAEWLSSGFHFSAIVNFFSENPPLFLLRLSHVLLAFGIGFAMSAAGRTMQLLLQNPLADPHVVGLSAGSTTAVLVSFLLFPKLSAELFFGFIPAHWIFASLGALISLGFIYVLFFRLMRSRSVASFALIGLLLNSGCSAFLMFVFARLNPADLSLVQSWTLGTIQAQSVPALTLLVFILVFSGLLLVRGDYALRVMSFGPEFAISQGVKVNRVRGVVLVLLMLISIASVSAAGSIGFVGLIVPHVTRRLFSSHDYRQQRPYLNAVLGGGVLVLADLASRTLTSPLELPVGVYTAMLSVPFLLAVLLKQKEKGAS